jgi:CDP-glucose 4,6-dehydratase
MSKESFWYRKKVFVTGCSGFLGSWLTTALVKRGSEVVGLLRDWVPYSRLFLDETYSDVTLVQGCVEDYAVLKRTLNEYEIDTVFHLDAQTIVGIANRNPLSTFETNIKGTWNILEACRRVSTVRQIVIASSDKAYGNQEKLPYDEFMPLQGAHPYDVSKSCADLVAHAYHETYHMPVCITRCGNFFGGGDLNFNRVVPGTIRSVLHNEQPIIRSDGRYIRDYIYIEDAVDAYLTLAEKMADRAIHGEAFNFSNEVQLTVLDLVKRILALMERSDLEPIVLGQAQNEIVHQYLSSAKSRVRLGWKPRFGLERGLEQTIAWYREFFEGRIKRD